MNEKCEEIYRFAPWLKPIEKSVMFQNILKFQDKAIKALGIKPENLSRAENELCLDVSGKMEGGTYRNIVSIILYESGYVYFFATRMEVRGQQKQQFRKTAVQQFLDENDVIEYIRKEFL